MSEWAFANTSETHSVRLPLSYSNRPCALTHSPAQHTLCLSAAVSLALFTRAKFTQLWHTVFDFSTMCMCDTYLKLRVRFILVPTKRSFGIPFSRDGPNVQIFNQSSPSSSSSTTSFGWVQTSKKISSQTVCNAFDVRRARDRLTLTHGTRQFYACDKNRAIVSICLQSPFKRSLGFRCFFFCLTVSLLSFRNAFFFIHSFGSRCLCRQRKFYNNDLSQLSRTPRDINAWYSP